MQFGHKRPGKTIFLFVCVVSLERERWVLLDLTLFASHTHFKGHINPMLKLAKLLHHKGFYVTFVNTQYNHKRNFYYLLIRLRVIIS